MFSDLVNKDSDSQDQDSKTELKTSGFKSETKTNTLGFKSRPIMTKTKTSTFKVLRPIFKNYITVCVSLSLSKNFTFINKYSS